MALAGLARTLSLQRANSRAKSLRCSGADAPTPDRTSFSHRLSQSIDALYVLSCLRDGLTPGVALVLDNAAIKAPHSFSSHWEALAGLSSTEIRSLDGANGDRKASIFDIRRSADATLCLESERANREDLNLAVEEISSMNEGTASLMARTSDAAASSVISNGDGDAVISCKSLVASYGASARVSTIMTDAMATDRSPWDQEFSSMSSYGSDQGIIQKHFHILERPACAPSPPHRESPMASLSDASSSSSLSSSEDNSSLALDMSSSDGSSDYSHVDVAEDRRRYTFRDCRIKADSSCYWQQHGGDAVQVQYTESLLTECVAIEKVSMDPYRDFRESMLEMAMVMCRPLSMETLEEEDMMQHLLYYYLKLNPVEVHDLILQAFADVWSELLSRVS